MGNGPRLFNEDEFEDLLHPFGAACEKYGYEGVIMVSFPSGAVASFHANNELGKLNCPWCPTIRLSNSSGKGSGFHQNDSHRANTGKEQALSVGAPGDSEAQ